MLASLKPKKIDLQELQEQQIEADGNFKASQEKKIKGNKDSSYELAEHAAHRIHMRLIRKVNDPIAKEYTTESEIVELSPAEYERMKSNGSFAGYDAQDVLHDPRLASVQKASQTGDVPAGTPSDPNGQLNSLQAAQMRYEELAHTLAPTDKSYEELLELIAPLEAELKAKQSTGTTLTPGAKPLRTKADYQARFKELYNEDAPLDKTIEQLKEAIDQKEKPAAA